MKSKKLSISSLVILFAVGVSANQIQPVYEELLNSNWTMTVLDAPTQGKDLVNKPLGVSLPTVLHMDLVQNKLIDDPFYRDNYLKLKWVSECKVQYKKVFKVEEGNVNRAV